MSKHIFLFKLVLVCHPIRKDWGIMSLQRLPEGKTVNVGGITKSVPNHCLE